MKPLTSIVPGETWGSFCRVVIGVWLAVWFYAAVHNQYLIRIHPEHFTVWHYKMPYLTNHTLLGIAYAGAASLSPGVVLGMALFGAGRLFNRPKLSPLQIVASTAWVWLGVEICGLTTGLIVWKTGQGLYPDMVYPDENLGLLITQTIQITAYLSGAIFSLILIAWTWRRRGRIGGKAMNQKSAHPAKAR